MKLKGTDKGVAETAFDQKYYDDVCSGKQEPLCWDCKYFKNMFCNKLRHPLENGYAMAYHSAHCGEK